MTLTPGTDHIQLDLETMSTRHDAAVLAIGAVVFDPHGSDTEESLRADPTRHFYCTISLLSNEQAKRHISAATIVWWLQQGKAAQDALMSGHQENLKNGCFKFRKWLSDLPVMPKRIWAKSPDFDCTILSNAHATVEEPWLFKFWETRCVRTLVETAYPDIDPPTIGVGTAHNALDDAIRQSLMVQHCHQVLASGRPS